MKKTFILLFIACIVFAANGQTYMATFQSSTPSGHNLQFNIYSSLSGNYAEVSGCVGSVSGNLIIPDSVIYNNISFPIKGIAGYAFISKTQIENVTLPNYLKYIGASAFSNCHSLESLEIPGCVDSIGSYAFSGCTSLSTINLPPSVNHISAYMMENCISLQSIIIPPSVTKIDNNAFYGCSSITSITIPENIIQIGGYAFVNCCNLDTVYYNAVNCTAAGWQNGSVYVDVFNKGYNPNNDVCSAPVANIFIGSNVENIPYHLFYGCSEVSSIIIPNSVQTIGSYAFSGCNLSSLWMKGIPPQIDNTVFAGTSTSIPIYTPCGTLSSYQNATAWSSFTHFVDACVTITATVNDFTKGGVIGGGNYMLGDTIILTAVPFSGAQFIGWSNGSQENPLVFEATQSQTLVAAFSDGPTPHDTIYLHDTTYINNYIYDTIIQYVDHHIHDTTFYAVYFHDTTIVHDTINVPIHDTIIAYINVPIHDTTYIIVHDTTYITSTDTVYIHDTVYITEEGIDDVAALNAKVYSSQGQIVVEGAEGQPVTLIDAVGRQLATKRDEYTPVRFDVPTSGTYLVKIGDYAARRVVVIR